MVRRNREENRLPGGGEESLLELIFPLVYQVLSLSIQEMESQVSWPLKATIY